MPTKAAFSEYFSSFPLLSLVEAETFKEFFNEPMLTVMDVGCGTNDTIPLFYDQLSHADLIRSAHVYLIDQNSLWLSILHEKLGELFSQEKMKRINITLVRKKLEELTISSPLEIRGDKPNPLSFRQNKFISNSIDIIHLNSNMLYWFDFFKADTAKILSNLEEIGKQNALLILSQMRGQPEPDLEPILDTEFVLKEIIAYTTRNQKVSKFQPQNYQTNQDSFRGYLFQKIKKTL